MQIPILAGFQIWQISFLKRDNVLNNVLLQLTFEYDCHLYANCLNCILTIYWKCLILQFSGCDMQPCVNIPIIRGVQKRTDTLWAKNNHILLKSILLELHFQHENHVDSILLSYFLIIYREFLLFQFLSRSICTHISIIRGVQNRRVTRGKEQLFSFKKCCLGSFFHWDESQLYANCLIYIPTVYHKSGLFQFFSRGICINF